MAISSCSIDEHGIERVNVAVDVEEHGMAHSQSVGELHKRTRVLLCSYVRSDSW